MAISKISAQNLSHLSNLESHCAKESAELRRGDREGHYGRCLTHFQIRAKEYATLMDRKGKEACLEHLPNTNSFGVCGVSSSKMFNFVV